MWRPYVPIGRRMARAAREAARLENGGRKAEPVRVEGRKIARTFWGESWCENLERYSDYSNRLPRGRSYVRNGLVIDLRITSGKISALVSGSSLYRVEIGISPLPAERWLAVKQACSGQIASVVDLLRGKLSDNVLEVLASKEKGLFPSPREIRMKCSCPDWASMCKHVAAVLYGVGAKLDTGPELLFVLRNVDQAELVNEAALGAALAYGEEEGDALGAGEMESIFGIEIEKEDPDAGKRAPAVHPASSPDIRPRKKLLPLQPSSRRRSRGSKDPKGILERHFARKETLRNADFARLFSVEPIVATRELGRLVATGILIRCGAKRGTYYLPGPRLRSRRIRV